MSLAILDLSPFRYATFPIAVGGSFVVRAAVVGALPFLLPMLLQVGFGLTPFESGSITFIGAFATLLSRFAIGPLLRRLGFDPAVSSAPFVATLVDVTGLVIYFTVGIVVLRGTLL